MQLCATAGVGANRVFKLISGRKILLSVCRVDRRQWDMCKILFKHEFLQKKPKKQLRILKRRSGAAGTCRRWKPKSAEPNETHENRSGRKSKAERLPQHSRKEASTSRGGAQASVVHIQAEHQGDPLPVSSPAGWAPFLDLACHPAPPQSLKTGQSVKAQVRQSCYHGNSLSWPATDSGGE